MGLCLVVRTIRETKPDLRFVTLRSWLGVVGRLGAKKRDRERVAGKNGTGEVSNVCLFVCFLFAWIERRKVGVGVARVIRPIPIARFALRGVISCAVTSRRRFEPALEIGGEDLVDDAERPTVSPEDVVASPERTRDAPLGRERG